MPIPVRLADTADMILDNVQIAVLSSVSLTRFPPDILVTEAALISSTRSMRSRIFDCLLFSFSNEDYDVLDRIEV